MANRFLRTLTIATAVTFSTLAAPSAFACGSAVADEVDEEAQLISRAQDALDRGEYQSARRLTSRIPGSVQRGRWIRAMSYVRDENASQRDVSEAVLQLRRIRATRPDSDIVSKVDLGEALARLPTGQKEARSILEPLAKADLIGSPHAYAALVRMGSSIPIRATALKRCREMADDKSLCTSGFLESEQMAEKKAADRWGPRLFTGLASASAMGVVLAAALCVRRRRQRSLQMAAYA